MIKPETVKLIDRLVSMFGYSNMTIGQDNSCYKIFRFFKETDMATTELSKTAPYRKATVIIYTMRGESSDKLKLIYQERDSKDTKNATVELLYCLNHFESVDNIISVISNLQLKLEDLLDVQ